MEKIPFKGKIRNVGNSFMVIIPKTIVGNEKELKQNHSYWFFVDKSSEE